MPQNNAEASPFELEPATTALLTIDFQRDFVDPASLAKQPGAGTRGRQIRPELGSDLSGHPMRRA